jgi:pimeloyl-ACP methyl ester carboxylesterase
MSIVPANGIDQYVEQAGTGIPLVFVHGAFVDLHMWDAQFSDFSDRCRVTRYDLRGHGKTGPSDRDKYSIELLADDLIALMDALNVEKTVLCGLSLGGMIAQSFAVKYPDRLRALVLADTAVSVRLTWTDKLQRYVLFPKWAMLLTLRLMTVEQFTRFSFWLAKVTRSEAWLGQDEATRDYVRERMLAMDHHEYVKIYDAIYDFDLLDLGVIQVPTLVLNGEHESGSVLRHTQEILRRVKSARAVTVPGAGHSSNMENPDFFNREVLDFLTHELERGG